MSIKPISPNKIICSLLFALCLFASCEQPANSGGDDEYNNPNAGASRDGLFSHNSGLYSQQFSLTLKAPEGSAVYYSTDGSIPSPEKVDNKVVFKYTSPIVLKNRNGEANVLATSANSTQMYMVSNDPRGSVPAVYTPTNAQVPKATVIRAVVYKDGKKSSDVITKTYFFGNNLANYANNPVISIVTDPRNLVDRDIGIMVRGASSNRWDSPPAPDVYNFQKKGQDWEREAYFELFEGGTNSRSVPLSTGVGIRVRGGWSRAAGQKSFSVYFKEQYGINNLRNYNLIPGAAKADGRTPVERYKSFMLRNGANDGDYTKFYDVFIQDLLRDRSFTAQAGVPCVVYLNGEYWGPYNLQERYSDNHTEYKYGVAKENVISFDNGELDDGNPGEETLFWNMMNMRNNNMSNTANYNAFCNVFDIDNFIDYWAAQIYIYNEDWPQNNFRLWRTRTVEPGNPYGDTKWRWQMFDTEFAMGIYNGGGLNGQNNNMDAFAKILAGDHYNKELFIALLANEDFCRKFVNTMMDLYNVNFHPNTFGPLLDRYAAAYSPLMGDNNTNGSYFSRWGGWPGQFQNKVNDARKYLNDIRGAMVNNYLPKYFGGSYQEGIANIGISSNNLRDVTISATGVSGASIKINTVTPNLAGSWTGKYYSGNQVTVTAGAPPAGYEFDGWTVTGGAAATPSALTTTVTFTGNVQITAKYRQTGVAVVPATGITLNRTTLKLDNGTTTFNLIATVTPSNATYKTVSWESSDYGVANVDSSGKVSAVRSGTATITASTLNDIKATCAVTVDYNPVLLDLAAAIQGLAVQVIDDSGTFNSVFSGIPLRSTWPGEGVTYAIINDGGVKKLQVNEHAMWGPGLDITPNFTFQAGDIIEVKGTHLGGSYSNGIQIQKEFVEPWSAFNGWYISPGQDFEGTFTLTAEDADWFNANIARDGVAMRIRTNGKDPWASPADPNYQSGYVGSFVIEQFKVTRP
jgi:hypothetical protein